MTSTLESHQADQILEGARAQRRRWPGVDRLPGWFRGKELDVLDAGERHRLYRCMLAAQPGTPWVSGIVSLVWVPKVIDNILADRHRVLWAGGAALYVLVIVGLVLLRRRNIVNGARRVVRESPDWPLRLQARDNP